MVPNIDEGCTILLRLRYCASWAGFRYVWLGAHVGKSYHKRPQKVCGSPPCDTRRSTTNAVTLPKSLRTLSSSIAKSGASAVPSCTARTVPQRSCNVFPIHVGPASPPQQGILPRFAGPHIDSDSTSTQPHAGGHTRTLAHAYLRRQAPSTSQRRCTRQRVDACALGTGGCVAGVDTSLKPLRRRQPRGRWTHVCA